MKRTINYFICKGSDTAQYKDVVYFHENGEWGFYSLADGTSSGKRSNLGAKAIQRAIAGVFEEEEEQSFSFVLVFYLFLEIRIMSETENIAAVTQRDAQWYRDYTRISEELKMKLYRYVCCF